MTELCCLILCVIVVFCFIYLSCNCCNINDNTHDNTEDFRHRRRFYYYGSPYWGKGYGWRNNYRPQWINYYNPWLNYSWPYRGWYTHF